MKLKSKILVLFLLPIIGFSQSKLEEGFDNLVNKTWFAEGTWESGTPFFQEITLKYGLNKRIVITDTKSIVNDTYKRYSDSAHGIRKYNEEKDEVEFWEFDFYGNITTGRVIVEGKNIWYKYEYGDETISDFWQYIDENNYKLVVGIYNDGKWEKTYLETKMTGKSLKK